jgi:hypothetical protein
MAEEAMIQDERRYSDVSAGVLTAMNTAEGEHKEGMAESVIVGLVTGTLTWFIWRALDSLFGKGHSHT